MTIQYKINFAPHISFNDPEIRETLGKIEGDKAFTQKLPLPPSLRQQIETQNIVRAVRATTAMTGNPLSEKEIAPLIDDPSRVADKVENREVINAWELYQHIRQVAEKTQTSIISEDLIRGMHIILTEGCRYQGNILGKYRKNNVVAGDYSPPDYKEIEELMHQFVSFINGELIRSQHPIIRATVAHFYLMSLRPFAAGNGRTARGLEAFILYKDGYNLAGFYSLANFYYLNRDEYLKQLQQARFFYKGNLTQFVKFSLNGYLQELEKVQDEIMAFYRQRTFREHLDGLKEKRAIGDRAFDFIHTLATTDLKISEDEFKRRQHPVVKTIFGDMNERTFYRDLGEMRTHKLIRVSDGFICPNYEVMGEPS